MPRSGHVSPGQGHLPQGGAFRLLIRRAGFETLAAHLFVVFYMRLVILYNARFRPSRDP